MVTDIDSDVFEVPRFLAPGITEIIGFGSECFMDRIDDNTCLGYMHDLPSPDLKE